MALPDGDAGVGHSFGLELDGVRVAGFQEVSGLAVEHDVVELKQQTPDGRYVVRRLPGRRKPAEVTLTRGLTSDSAFDDWVRSVAEGSETAHREAAIVLHDEAGEVLRRFTLQNAWPSKLEIGSLVADGTAVLTEKLVLTVDGIELE
jgi:phage tail-like protein